MATVFITGANKGIGLELAKQLHARGDTIHASCRSSSPELDALGAHVHSG
ncbi:MAG: SDR family NAD(P)-dependent oxidoreductase, partial [Deltaproteobacteria bacterium]|nr:SDR family NAD(P)-dependent oxidoreductase [Deltaproteobacteria bacterium]